MSRLTRLLNESLWLITDERFSVLRGVIELIETGKVSMSDEPPKPEPAYLMFENGARVEYAAETRAAEGPTKAVLVVPFAGTIYPRSMSMMPMSGGVNLQATMAMMRRAVRDPGIGSIIGDFDSPGGMVAGVPEAAAEIRSLRGIKPMSAIANFQCASAAYYLASQFDEVVAPPSSSLGSIGVIAQYFSAAKALENEGYSVQTMKYPDKKAEADGVSPLSEEAVAFRMAQIKTTYDEFEANVAAGLGIDAAKVRSDFGQGRSLDAKDAVRVGMATRLGTFESVLADHVSGNVKKMRGYQRTKRADDDPLVLSQNPPAPDPPADPPAPPSNGPEMSDRGVESLRDRWKL